MQVISAAVRRKACSAKSEILNPIVILLTFLSAISLPAKSQSQTTVAGYQASAAASAASADEALTNAQDAVADAQSQYSKDQNNGAALDQLNDDRNVWTAAQTAENSAAAAAASADAASQDANSSSTVTPSQAEADSQTAHDGNVNAQADATIAARADANDGDAYGNPNSTAGQDAQALDKATLDTAATQNAAATAQDAANQNPDDQDLQAAADKAEAAYTNALDAQQAAQNKVDGDANSSNNDSKPH
jgi:trimeric autotransporter adhesin